MNSVLGITEDTNRHIDDGYGYDTVSDGVGDCERVHL